MSFKSVCVPFTVLAILAYLQCSYASIPPTCDSLVYCQGELLHTVQMARLEQDSKTFVDKSMLNDVPTTLSNFDVLMNETDGNPTFEQLRTFVDANFISENELDDWIPDDFIDEPPFLSQIVDDEVRQFAKDIVALWKILGRKVKPDVQENPDQHSLIYVPHGFIIPGGRFREYYYWDSYWIIDGLLVSGMRATVSGMIDNFLKIVDQYGHVPNGGRVYYMRRSQPPLLSHMAKLYFEATQDIEWLKERIELLEQEVEFWRKNRMVTFTLDFNNTEYRLAAYRAESAGPRPESYYEDFMTANFFKTEPEKTELYIQLKSAAESGWDFSSRWLFDEYGGQNANLSFISTSRVAAVDLNAFLYGAFSNIAQFYGHLNDAEKQIFWSQEASNLKQSIDVLLWNAEDGVWHDLDIDRLQHRRYFTPANLSPLWTKAYNTENATDIINGVITYLKDQNIPSFQGGIPTSIANTGEQWDLPNAWPCLQSIVIEGLENSGVEAGQVWAREFAERWVRANMIGFNNTGYMFEKYDAEVPGQYGGGGEYNVQTGFGWTNGVVLKFIQTYYTG